MPLVSAAPLYLRHGPRGLVLLFFLLLLKRMMAIYLLVIQQKWPRALRLLLTWLSLLASSSAGAQQWQQAVVGSAGYRVLATAADAAGNVYIAGRLIGTAAFGATTLTSANAPLGSNAFVAKWSSATQGFVWAQLISSNGYGEAEAIALSGANVYVAGSVTGPATLGGFSVSGGGFVARLTDAGTSASFAWAQPAGSDRATALVVQGTSVFVAGSFSGTQAFGPNTLVSAGSSDMFVAKLVDTGPGTSYVWGQRGGSGSADIANALAVDGANVYVTGYFYGATASFGTTTLANASNLYEVFIAKLTDAGSTASFGWAQRAGGAGSDAANGIAATGGSVYVTGTFQGAATFGPFTLAATSGNDLDIFIVKLADAGSSSSFGWAQRVGGTGYENTTALVSNAAGVYLAGYFQSPTIDFGQIPLTRIGGGDLFVARLTDTGAAGRFDWAQQAGGGTGYNYLAALSVVGRVVYTAGVVSPPVSFGSQAFAGSGGGLLGYWARLSDNAAVLATAAPRHWVGVEVCPNPAHASVQLHLPAAAGATQATLTVLDALGRAVRRQQVPLAPAATTAEVPLLGLAPGLYYLRLQAGGQLATHALAVE